MTPLSSEFITNQFSLFRISRSGSDFSLSRGCDVTVLFGKGKTPVKDEVKSLYEVRCFADGLIWGRKAIFKFVPTQIKFNVPAEFSLFSIGKGLIKSRTSVLLI